MSSVTSAASAAAAHFSAALSDAQYFESSMVRVEDIRRQLDSRTIKHKLDAMKRVVALISLGKDASTFFPDVVKNVVAPSLEVKKLVYLYLVHYAEEKQDLALLAINSFQKDLSDYNQHIRALSLRVLSSIRVKVILQVVILAISNAAKDSSSYVRKAAALAIGKVCALDPASKEELMQPLQDLVSDKSTQVMGSAIAAFEEVCPYNFELIHPHYRRICATITQVDPWGQITIINMLLRYARVHFAYPYSTHDESISHTNPDLALLFNSISPLFHSLNNSVVMSVIAVYYHLASRQVFCNQAVKPLMRLVAIEDVGGQAVALNIAAAVAVRHPSVLIPYISEFFVSAGHSAPIRALRMEVLTKICAGAGEEGGIGSKPHARRAILAELKEYLFRTDNELAALSARAFGYLATAHPGSTPAIVKVLSSIVGTARNPIVVSESIGVLRCLLQRHPTAQAKALPQLIAMLLTAKDSEKISIQEPAARASIIWLISEFYEKVQAVGTEALRLLAKNFSQEEAEVKLQILNLAAKVVAWNENAESADDSVSSLSANVELSQIRLKLLEYVVSCARYDRDYDVRDKARMLQFLFLSQKKSPLFKAACQAYLQRKPVPVSTESQFGASLKRDDNLDPDVILGSLAHVLNGRRLPGFRPLEPWAAVDSDDALRGGDDGLGGIPVLNRDYAGIGSSDFHHSVANSQTVWEAPTGISSANIGTLGSLPQASSSTAASNASLIVQHTSSAATTNVATVDPERFYGSGEEEEESSEESSSEYDEESDDSEEETASPIQNGTAASGAGEDLLLGLISEDIPSTKPASAIQATSNNDINALLGNLAVSEVAKADTPTMSTSTVQNRTEWCRVVESWNAGGIQIDASFLRTASIAGPDVTPIILRVTNRGKSELTNISFSSQDQEVFTSRNTIDTLAPSSEQEVKVDVRLRGKTTGVRFEVLTDGKSVGFGEFKPQIGHVIRPHPRVSPVDFVEIEKTLTGMFGSEAKLDITAPINNDWFRLSKQIERRILDACFVSHVETRVGTQSLTSTERFSISFAGYLPGLGASREKRSVLIRITVGSGDDKLCPCLLWIGCEDVLFSANLLQVCRSAIVSSGAM